MEETPRPADRPPPRPHPLRLADTPRPPSSGGRAAALLLLGMAGAALPRAADAQIGIMGGYSRDSLGELDAGEEFSLADRADGFHTGIFLDIGLGGRFAIRPAIVYRRLQDAAFSGVERTSANIEIVEFPLDVRLSVPLPVATPYLLAGPVLMFPSSARSSIDQALAAPRVRLDLGVGLELDIGFRLWPEIRFGKGLGGLAGSAAEQTAGASSSLETLMIRLGVSF